MLERLRIGQGSVQSPFSARRSKLTPPSTDQHFSDHMSGRQADYQANEHAKEHGEHGLMNGAYPLDLYIV